METLKQALTRMTSSFHCVKESERILKEEGFEPLSLAESWKLECGKSYFVNIYDSSLVAFKVNKEFQVGQAFRLAAAHTDQPGFRIKGNPEVRDGKYEKLNVEVYGGPILNTWLDRPLSVSGKVSLRGENPLKLVTTLVDFKRPIVVIPNLAIHQDREVNKGKELNRQIDMLPLIGMSDKKESNTKFFMEALAKELQVSVSDILDFELVLYSMDQPMQTGLLNEFLLSPRIDNITSVCSCLSGIISGTREEGLDLIALFDHEEVGSKSKKGAASIILPIIIEKIYDSLGGTRQDYLNAAFSSTALSVDVAHAIHPNRPEKSDITNKVYLNDGVVIKLTSSQAYAGDCEGAAMVQSLCEHANIPYQKFYNRSDATGGSTLGAIANTLLPISIQDIGIPLLSMHSAAETMGVKDQYYMDELLKNFFSV